MRPGYQIKKILLDNRLLTGSIALLFLILFGATALLISNQMDQLHYEGTRSDQTVAALLSDYILEHERAAISLLQVYAGRLSLTGAVQRRNDSETHQHLKELRENNKEIDLTFVTDKKGVLWANYPIFPEALGKDLSYRDWYKGVSASWKPYISGVFKLIVGNRPLAVAVAVPILDQKGEVVGILANSQQLHSMEEVIRRIPLKNYSQLTLIDQAGHIIYSTSAQFRYTEKVTSHPLLSLIKQVSRGEKKQFEVPYGWLGAGAQHVTVHPVKEIGWTVIAAHRKREVLQAGAGGMAATAITSILLFVALILSLFYARKHALLSITEARFRVAAEGALDAFFIFRSLRNQTGAIIDFEFLYLNSSGEKLIGLNREQVIGKMLCELIPINRIGGFFEKYVQVVETGKTLEEEFPIAAEEIKATWIRHQVVPLLDGVAITSRNISERKRNEEEIQSLNQALIQRAKQLENANQELDAFAYSVSHDLRSPLRGIDGYSRILEEDYLKNLDEDGRFYLSQIRGATREMNELIDDLLEFSRLGRRGMKRMSTDMSSLFQGIFESFKKEIPHRRLTMQMEELPEVPGDPAMLTLVVRNLLDNAIKFTRPREEALITVGSRQIMECAYPGQTPTVTYFVRDNGVGFEMVYADKIFKVFQRLHRAEEFEGTGIGLALVKRIIERHGGRVWAEGVEGEGAVFYFSLPNSNGECGVQITECRV